jgi:hypothetical protein
MDCRIKSGNDEGKNERKKEAERRQAHCLMPARKRRAGRATEKGGLRRPPLAGALAYRRSTCGSRQRDFRPEGSASGQASRKRCESCGVPHAPFPVTAMHLARRS